MEFEIPSEKLARFMEGATFLHLLLLLLKARRFLIRTLASWVGLLQSFRLAIGPLVSLMCRSLYDNIRSAQYWSSYIKLSDLTRFQPNWWLENLEVLNGFPICKEPIIVKFEFSVAGDASDGGFFVYRVNSKQRLFSRPFTAVESQESSAFKELTAVHETWTNEDILAKFSGKNCWTFIDNKAVTFILSGGSRNLGLQKLSLEIFLALRKFRIFLVLGYQEKTKLSFRLIGDLEIFKSDDYSLDPVTMNTLSGKFGRFIVDCMAIS
jgi:hypothetical protein